MAKSQNQEGSTAITEVVVGPDKISLAKSKIAEWQGDDPIDFYTYLWQVGDAGMEGEKLENTARTEKIDASFKELRLSLPGVVQEEEETTTATRRVGKDRKNGYTYYTGTLEILRRAGDTPLTKDEIAKQFKDVLGYVSKGKDEKSFGNSLYVSGINKLQRDDLVEHRTLPNSRAGGYVLTDKGRRAIKERASA